MLIDVNREWSCHMAHSNLHENKRNKTMIQAVCVLLSFILIMCVLLSFILIMCVLLSFILIMCVLLSFILIVCVLLSFILIMCVLLSFILIINVVYSKTPLLRPPLCLRKNGLYNGLILILS